MLCRTQRLTRTQMAEVMARGATRHTPHFTVRALPTLDTTSRGAVVVPKKVVPGAVKRHLLKRRVYTTLKEMFPRLSRPILVAVIAKKDAPNLPFSDIQEEISTLLGL